VAGLFDESNPAVLELIRQAIRAAHRCHRPISLCGQAPSDDPGFVDLLLAEGIDAISFNPDALMRGRLRVAAAEQRLDADRSGSTAIRHDP
jgi:pyruvate,water dikinase